LGHAIEANDETAIRRFRRVHAAALLITFAQLVLIVWGVIYLSYLSAQAQQ